MMKASRAIGLALGACVAVTTACSDALVGPAPSTDRGAIFDEVWHQFDLHYSFFQLKKINWDSLGGVYRPEAEAASTDDQLASVIANMLAELKDVHVSLTPTGVTAPMRYLSTADTTQTFFDASVIANRYVSTATTSPSGSVTYGMLSPTIGYLRIASFQSDALSTEVDGAMDAMRSASSLVVDVRNNSGGKYAIAVDVAGRFADRSQTYGFVRYRNGQSHDAFTGYADETVSPSGARQFHGPLYVLSNRRDFSSAEDFILAMRVRQNTTIVGDTTAGASGGPMVRELPNGWTFQLSEWIEYTPSKQTFEGVGLAPDVFVRGTAADRAQKVDGALERAIALAQSR
ncbi:MAG: S41 family peptidase [Gemmatimonadaceae bacterium]